MKKSTFTASLIFSFSAMVYAEKPTLHIYTYDSFAADWGAAPKLAPLFEQQCQCQLKFHAFEDGVTMFNRLRLEGKKSKADVVLGLDHFILPEAKKSGLFVAHQQHIGHLQLSSAWQDETFLPYDYGEYAFIYNKEKLANPPRSLKALIEQHDLKVIYQDPRTSTVGRGLLFWVNQVYGDQAMQAWQQLATHTVTIGKGWSETYGAFLKGEADMVLSYTTSPLYHQWYEQDERYAAAPFAEGHLQQIEVAAVTKNSQQAELARQFLGFLLQPEAQKIMVTYNIMQPVKRDDVEPLLKSLPTYSVLPFELPSKEKVKQWIEQWQQAVSK